MKSKDAKAREIARKLVELQRQLLETLPADREEVEHRVFVEGREYTIRVFWGRCVMIACKEGGNGGSDELGDNADTLRLPISRDATVG